MECIITLNPDDVDECTVGTANCEKRQLCQNTIGSFYCVCKPGFPTVNEGKICLDETGNNYNL